MAQHVPLTGSSIAEATGEGRFTLAFDDPLGSRLFIEGAFELKTADRIDRYDPPSPPWVRDVLSSLAGVRVVQATYDNHGNLRIVFADSRELAVPDSPFESWHFSNAAGLRLHGGIGRVVAAKV